MALQDFGMGARVLIAAVIVQQILENLIAPRILGSFTGLNPVWALISVLTGARVGGLLGVIVAVPTAVVIKTALSALRGYAPLTERSESIAFGEATHENDITQEQSNLPDQVAAASVPEASSPTAQVKNSFGVSEVNPSTTVAPQLNP